VNVTKWATDKWAVHAEEADRWALDDQYTEAFIFATEDEATAFVGTVRGRIDDLRWQLVSLTGVREELEQHWANEANPPPTF